MKFSRDPDAADLAVLQSLGEIAFKIRMRCREDPVYLGYKVLGYDYLAAPADFHVECARYMVDKENYLMLAPRGHIKTTLSCVVGSVFEVCREPNVRILLTHGTLDNAKAIGKETMAHFRETVLFRKFFPELCPQTSSQDPTILSYVTPARTRVMKEPTISVGAPGATKTGMHYDVIKASDLVNEQNVPPKAGPDQMERIKEYFRTFTPLLDQTNEEARVQVDGTRWHFADLYSEILDDPRYDHFRRIVVGIDEDAAGRPVCLWPQISAKTLAQRKAEAGAYLWAANYKNSPVADGATSFLKSWFHTYKELPCEVDEMRVAITVDLAISEKHTADRTAIVVTGICPEGNLYVLAIRCGRWRPQETIEQIILLDAAYKPQYIGVESVAYQKAMVYWLDDIARRDWNRSLPVRPLLPDGNKLRRASILQVHAERYGIYVKPEHDLLVEECLQFPVGKHDDLVDALAYRGLDLINPILYTPPKQASIRSVEHPPQTAAPFFEEVDKMIQQKRGFRFSRPVFRRVTRWT